MPYALASQVILCHAWRKHLLRLLYDHSDNHRRIRSLTLHECDSTAVKVRGLAVTAVLAPFR